MFLSILCLVQLKEVLSKPGFYSFRPKRFDLFSISLRNNLYNSFYSISENAIFNITNDKGVLIEQQQNNVCGFIAGDNNVLFNILSDNVFLQIWIFPKSACNHSSVLFTTPHKLLDSFKLRNDIQNICLFFGNERPEMKLTVKYKDGLNDLDLSFFADNYLDNPLAQCSKPYCLQKLKKPFFARLSNIVSNHTITVEYALSKEESLDIPCDHHVAPYIKDGDVVYDEGVFKEVIITCHNEMLNIPDSNMVTFFIVIGSSSLIVLVLYFCGCCRWLSRMIRGKIFVIPDPSINAQHDSRRYENNDVIRVLSEEEDDLEENNRI